MVYKYFSLLNNTITKNKFNIGLNFNFIQIILKELIIMVTIRNEKDITNKPLKLLKSLANKLNNFYNKNSKSFS